jgi:hypothetical protein
MLEAALYGLACLAVLGFTFWSRKVSKPAFLCALMLLGTFLLTNILNQTAGYPTCFKLYAPINLICGGVASYFLFRKPQFWSLLLALSFLFQIGLELAFALQGGYADYGLVPDFMANENRVFTLQLTLLCVPGGLHVLGLVVRRMLPGPVWYRLERLAFWRTRPKAEKG